MQEIDQTKRKASVWKKKYTIALISLIICIGLCVVLVGELGRRTKIGTDPEKWVEIPVYPLDKQAIADEIVACGFAERNWTITENDYSQYEGEEGSSFTIRSDQQEISLGRVMGILSRSIEGERTLGINVRNLEDNVAILRAECEEAIIFDTRLFGGFSSETRVSDEFMKEFDVEKAIEWEKEMVGRRLYIYRRMYGFFFVNKCIA